MIGIVVAAAVLVYGAVLLGLGISGLHNEHALAASGVPAVAQVSATHGYGRDTIQVTFVAGARTVQGTINVGGRSYLTGQPVPVVYDPTNPTVVGLAGDIGNTSSAWAETVVGIRPVYPACPTPPLSAERTAARECTGRRARTRLAVHHEPASRPARATRTGPDGSGRRRSVTAPWYPPGWERQRPCPAQGRHCIGRAGSRRPRPAA